MFIDASQTGDTPKTAMQAEAEAAESLKSDDGAPGQTSEAETDYEQSEKSHDPQSDVEAEFTPSDSSETPEQSTEVCSVSLIRANQ